MILFNEGELSVRSLTEEDALLLAAWLGDPRAGTQERIFGMDQFIGEPDYWNRGIGTVLIQSMVKYLLVELKADRIVMDPQAWNTRAVRVYEKCGFIKKKLLPQHERHEGEYRDCWLIELDRVKGSEHTQS
ncbi:GNAT family N-acetyltransferase [Paenibacillus sp.]|jgi:aminoglycoside 6'-N-acetyltransferase|uniref:GNAT family N-acetyltransferase n=1 Tax=Paenibacillus sp. TaxID=58172 RepID=UPI00282A70AA|nr:GNAT family N-acetyltransferase [Paenibacillus sp.]MDR0268418.1 acetyltransferase [Paenibacillus sp.]